MRVRNNTLFSDIFWMFANISAVLRGSTGNTEFNGYYGVQRVLRGSTGITGFNGYYGVQRVLRSSTGITEFSGYYGVQRVLRGSTGITGFNGYYGVQRVLRGITGFNGVGGCSYGLPTINHYLVKWLDSADGWGHTITRAHFFGSLQYSRHAKHRQTNTQIDVIQGRTFNGNSISWRLVS